MKTEESLYIKILLWAYDRQALGFREEELISHFELNKSPELRAWYQTTFRHGTNDNHAMIANFIYANNAHLFSLSEKGMSAAIDYLDLRDARENSRDAKIIALWSIWIAVIVGIFQIIIGLLQMIGYQILP